MRLMGMRNERKLHGVACSTERLKSGAASHWRKRLLGRAEIFALPLWAKGFRGVGPNRDQWPAGIGWGDVPCRNSATNGVAGKACTSDGVPTCSM
jgi:hypothetical protein